MSDDLDGAHGHQHILHNGESYIKLADAAETFKRLRAWRTAVYNALAEWHDPPRDGENPKDALRRLVQYEITAALDPAVSQAAADLVATARREGMAEAADLCDDLPDHQGGICAIAIRMMIDEEDKKAAIRAAAKEMKP